MKSRFVLTPRARADLEDIWEYTAERWGADQAAAYIRLLEKAIKKIADRPTLGKACPEVREGYRKFSAGSHLLFYRESAGTIDIVRIAHERMDYERRIF